MFKKFILVLILIFTFSTQIFAQFAGGSGTEENPYKISTVEELQEIRNHPNDYFIQTNNIDASVTENWNAGEGFIPIGDDVVKFSGSYEGNNFKISNLYINLDQWYVGLFGRVEEGEIKNLFLEEVNIFGGNNTGALVGQNEASIIYNSRASGSIEGRSGLEV
ncbi:MAG: GLUG motif-containing protein [Balneolaceae bacterium]